MRRDKVLAWIATELDISWQKLVFMDQKLLPASARCRRYAMYVAFVAICWNNCFIQSYGSRLSAPLHLLEKTETSPI